MSKTMDAKTKLAALAMAAAMACGCLGLAACGQKADTADQGQQGTEQQAEQEQEAKTVKVEVDAPGKQDGSTPAVVTVTDSAGKKTSHAVSGSSDEVEVGAEGQASAKFIGIVNPDGSIERAGEAKQADDGTLKCSYAHVAADAVESGEVEKIVSDIASAIESGDKTLSGEAGKKVAETAAANAKANAAVDSSKVDEAKQSADSSAERAEQASSASDSGSADGGSASAAAGDSASGDNGASADTAQASSSHTHNWVDRTEQRWVSNPVQVVVQEAYDEPIYGYVSHTYCNLCGAMIDNDHLHIDKHLDADGDVVDGYSTTVMSSKEITGYNHHDAVTETQDQGHWETVTAGKVCSTCGAEA